MTVEEVLVTVTVERGRARDSAESDTPALPEAGLHAPASPRLPALPATLMFAFRKSACGRKHNRQGVRERQPASCQQCGAAPAAAARLGGLTNSEVTRTVRSTGAEQSTVKVELRAFCESHGWRAMDVRVCQCQAQSLPAAAGKRRSTKLTPRAAILTERWEDLRTEQACTTQDPVVGAGMRDGHWKVLRVSTFDRRRKSTSFAERIISAHGKTPAQGLHSKISAQKHRI